MVHLKKVNDEVFYIEDPIIQVGPSDIAFLKKMADSNARRRVRLCAHRDANEKLHEMLIVLKEGVYIAPHKHLSKVESFHIIEGLVDVIVFDEVGKIFEVIPLGDYHSGRAFYYRLPLPYYHTLLLRSEFLIFHEITNGPFVPEECAYAPWAPQDSNQTAIDDHVSQLSAAVAAFVSKRDSGCSASEGSNPTS